MERALVEEHSCITLIWLTIPALDSKPFPVLGLHLERLRFSNLHLQVSNIVGVLFDLLLANILADLVARQPAILAVDAQLVGYLTHTANSPGVAVCSKLSPLSPCFAAMCS